MSHYNQVLQANGGVIDFFADGAENHVAQIAPAGAMRVWAEPETGGEAYIPLAPSKRERSEAILDATAARFGKVVVDATTRRYASGALVEPQRHYVSQGNLPARAPAPAPAPATAAPPVVYVQNPWTGEYLEARTFRSPTPVSIAPPGARSTGSDDAT
jgi:hypothetical protein